MATLPATVHTLSQSPPLSRSLALDLPTKVKLFHSWQRGEAMTQPDFRHMGLEGGANGVTRMTRYGSTDTSVLNYVYDSYLLSGSTVCILEPLTELLSMLFANRHNPFLDSF